VCSTALKKLAERLTTFNVAQGDVTEVVLQIVSRNCGVWVPRDEDQARIGLVSKVHSVKYNASILGSYFRRSAVVVDGQTPLARAKGNVVEQDVFPACVWISYRGPSI